MYTEDDLDNLIAQKLTECSGLPHLCPLLQTAAGREKVRLRIKGMLFDEGVRDIDAALALIESEISFAD